LEETTPIRRSPRMKARTFWLLAALLAV